ncbi:MAG: D,L-glycerol 3-phosphate phosphatase [Acidimicrobiales bacterium]|nr:D,L-glycerol 3-phosphate phosphatase [Acidimicrobiales bacterium]
MVLDLDGVIWRGQEPIPGSPEAVVALQREAEAVVFCTNNSSVTVDTHRSKLEGFGIAVEGEIVTSALVCAEMVEPGETVLVCAGAGVVEALESRGVRVVREGDADAVMVGYHTDFDYTRMAAASTAVLGGARLLATNDDPTFPSPAGMLPGGGAILASISTAAGTEPTVAGKPYQPMADYLLRRYGNEGLVIGDRPSGDGGLARRMGYRFGLVLSGVTSQSDLPVEPAPDIVAEDLRALVEALT